MNSKILSPIPELDFSDVLIIPKTSTLISRADVDLSRTFKLKHAGWLWSGIPIIAANMDTIGTTEMSNVFSEYEMLVALHKHYDLEELVSHLIKNEFYSFYSMGISDADIDKLQEFKKITNRWPRMVCVDVANGYTKRFSDTVKYLRDMMPETFIMAGNVVTGAKTEEIIMAGADCLKIGIGPGCLAEGSRILMSNGRYKNIENIESGDRIITSNGTAATVKRSFCTGIRKVTEVKNNSFYKPLTLTPDHLCYVGDLSSSSMKTIGSAGYKKILERQSKTIPKETKIKWLQISELLNRNMVGLLPSNIEWELPDYFEKNISDFFTVKRFKDSYNQIIKSDYNLGYMLGFFLGDGTAKTNTNQRTPTASSKSGVVTFAIHRNDTSYIKKLTNCIHNVTGKCPVEVYRDQVCVLTLYSKQWAEILANFNKRQYKRLPDVLYCNNKEYNQGLYDGLIDSDGHIEIEVESNRHSFTNTSPYLMELFGFLTYNLYGYFPVSENTGYNSSELVNSVNECFRSRHTEYNLSKRIINNEYQVIKLMEYKEKEIEVPVYDLEIDDQSHSFIANNTIVHNSVCTTRIQAGVGRPQLSAIIECADAAHGLRGLICADGGCTSPGDIAKALGAGADFVMIGGMFAGTQESGGEPVYDENGKKTHVRFYGMSSAKANEDYAGGLSDYRAAEGKEVLVPYKGRVAPVIQEILGGIRSTMTYVGAEELKELTKRTTFVRVNNQHNKIFD